MIPRVHKTVDRDGNESSVMKFHQGRMLSLKELRWQHMRKMETLGILRRRATSNAEISQRLTLLGWSGFHFKH